MPSPSSFRAIALRLGLRGGAPSLRDFGRKFGGKREEEKLITIKGKAERERGRPSPILFPFELVFFIMLQLSSP